MLGFLPLQQIVRAVQLLIKWSTAGGRQMHNTSPRTLARVVAAMGCLSYHGSTCYPSVEADHIYDDGGLMTERTDEAFKLDMRLTVVGEKLRPC
jgi:hypothetical protein